MRGADFISSMPDEILHHILSFTPTKLAITTSVLSKRWRPVWYGTSSVSIECESFGLTHAVDKTLRSFSSPKLTRFDLSIGFNLDARLINRWIDIAISRKVEDLSIVLKASHRFKNSFYENSNVKKLHVTMPRIQGGFPVGPCPRPRPRPWTPQRFDMAPRCVVSWSSLRELSLTSCDLPGKSFAKMISGCSMLEILILNFCRRLTRLDLSKSLNLRRLEIAFDSYFISEPKEIIAPHIRYLKLTNCFRPCNLVDVTSLTEAYIGLSDYSLVLGTRNVDFDFVRDMVVKLLENLQNMEKLTLQGVILQILSLATLGGVPFPQLKAKELIVETMLVQTIMPGVAQLLQNSPQLKKITIYTRKGKAIADEELENYLKTKVLNPRECWGGFFPAVEKDSSDFDAKSEHVVSFMELVLGNSEILETMVLRLEGYLRAREYQKLLIVIPTAFRNKDGKAKEILKSLKIIP